LSTNPAHAQLPPATPSKLTPSGPQPHNQPPQTSSPPSLGQPAQLTTSAHVTPNPPQPNPHQQVPIEDPPNNPPKASKIYPFQFSDIKEGDIDPTLGKKVKWLISSNDNFIVYISEDDQDSEGLYVEWNMNDGDILKPDTGPYLNRVGQLESVDLSYLSETRKISYKRMLAEGVARLFQGNLDASKAALDLAESWITARNTEVARRWYLVGSGLVALVSAFAIFALGYWNQQFRAFPYFNLIIGTAFGGLGAWLSIIQRSRTAGLDVAAGPILHYLEGAFRIIAGCLGALLVAMAIKAGLFIQADRLSLITVICMIAGVSERLVPSFIEQMESRTSGGVAEDKQAVQKH
jgi:hypothetical protein